MTESKRHVEARSTTSRLTLAEHWEQVLVRWAVNRSGHRVEPGLYALGAPTPDSPVFVTANDTLSFGALRSALAGIDGYILVLDTRGINARGQKAFRLSCRIRASACGGLARISRDASGHAREAPRAIFFV